MLQVSTCLYKSQVNNAVASSLNDYFLGQFLCQKGCPDESNQPSVGALGDGRFAERRGITAPKIQKAPEFIRAMNGCFLL